MLFSKKILVRESGMLAGLCDCHCHLLPGVDDGVKELRDTLQLLQLWEEQGMQEVWLTPHVMEDIPNKTHVLKEKFAALQEAYKGPIRLYLASENMLDNLFLQRLENDDLLPLPGERCHLLVETSYFNPPMDMESMIDKTKERGYTPVLAHPERYQYMDMGDYRRWRQRGVLMQLNIPSLVGAYGPEVQKKAELLLRRDMYDYCGTDTHSLRFAEYFLDSKIRKSHLRSLHELLEQQEK